MGLFDSVESYSCCPYCKKQGLMEGQTKDLGRGMYSYSSLGALWITDKMDKILRNKLPTFPTNPFDKSFSVWKNQAEKAEAFASVPDKVKDIKSIKVLFTCDSLICRYYALRRDVSQYGYVGGLGRVFYAKLPVRDGLIFDEPYDIEADENLSEKELDSYKKKYKKIYTRLKQIYKNDIEILSNWPNL